MKIGVFDSGVGGLSVVRAIQKELPGLEIDYQDDQEHIPYGSRQTEEIYSFVLPILNTQVKNGSKIIVIACNTVTTNLIERLRQELDVPLVGMEPMIKPAAAASKTGVIAVCATPLTLKSQRYRWLKDNFAKGVKVLEPDCSDWSYMIENNQVDRTKIETTIKTVIAQRADQIVLGCTHYHWIEGLIKKISSDQAEVIQPEIPVINQLKKVIASLN